MLTLLKHLFDEKILRPSDYYYLMLLNDKQQPYAYPQAVQDLALFLIASLMHKRQMGNVCLPLTEKLLSYPFDLYGESNETLRRNILQKISIPFAEWQNALRGNVLFTENPQASVKPLVIAHDALFLYRQWVDEKAIADYFLLQKNAQHQPMPFSTAEIKQVLNTVFPNDSLTAQKHPQESHHWQKIAVATALRQRFSIITGGPGTGKTTTVTRLLLALQLLYAKTGQLLNIRLVAPTGKAAARLKESVQRSIVMLQKSIHISPEILASLPEDAATLHRLLGARPLQPELLYNENHKLHLDVLVVDEVSMIDLAMMANLVRALPANTKLILLGDEDQLDSVEYGAVLASLSAFQYQSNQTLRPYSAEHCAFLQDVTGENLPSAQGHWFRDHLCQLQYSHRFGQYPAIGKLAGLINRGLGDESWCFLAEQSQQRQSEVSLVDYAQRVDPQLAIAQQIQHCSRLIVEQAAKDYQAYFQQVKHLQQEQRPLQSADIHAIFTAFNQIRYLTALRQTPLGSEQLNQHIFHYLRQQGQLSFPMGYEHFIGKPIMIRKNDPTIGLYNGDVGLYLLDFDEKGEARGRYWFENGQSELASRLPEHESAFFMTVHKSQGSEFNHTLLVLPLTPSPVLTKELIYTGVTRAKERLTIFAEQDIWQKAITKKHARQSQLAKHLDLK